MIRILSLVKNRLREFGILDHKEKIKSLINIGRWKINRQREKLSGDVLLVMANLETNYRLIQRHT